MTRALVVIGSAKGSPGATTLILALAECWPTSDRQPRPLVVEADPSGGDVAARFELSDSPGLMAVAAAAAARRAVSPQVLGKRVQQVLGKCVQLLPGGAHVVVGPTGAQQAAAAVRLFAGNGAALLRAGMGSDGSVLVDVGRLQPETAWLVEAADRLLLVSRGEVDALAHAASTAADLRGSSRCVELVVVGPSPYPPSEIREVLGVQRVHRMPWDARTARALAGRASASPRRWRTAPLVRAASDLAWHLVTPVVESGESPGRDLTSLTTARPVPGQAAARTLEEGDVR
ncbi:hypothetical protein [Streptantibioticus ferralitis]|uniref:MinD-like ATPase involved in chromosome partitioning or flagellar assembly n=1 Tax=Streptantibioticus ferralitis TaxID=236510 RepID=A0ABT5ZBB0_9ACTN|nr:hypothetical protein [Streptantibioticus ferralitis]MDF2261127.1 hypothetical protein [Streptantibioticus ferralitis]